MLVALGVIAVVANLTAIRRLTAIAKAVGEKERAARAGRARPGARRTPVTTGLRSGMARSDLAPAQRFVLSIGAILTTMNGERVDLLGGAVRPTNAGASMSNMLRHRATLT